MAHQFMSMGYGQLGSSCDFTKTSHELVHRLVAVCSSKLSQESLVALENILYNVTKASFLERTEMEDEFTKFERNGLSVKDFLKATSEATVQKDFRLRVRNMIYTILCAIKTNSKMTHESLCLVLVKSGIAEEAAIDLADCHSCYRNSKAEGQLVLDCLCMLRNSTIYSHEAASACSQVVSSSAYLYLDPRVNDTVVVQLAAIVIKHVVPWNTMHEMLFYDDFLNTVVSRTQSSPFVDERGIHVARQESELITDGGYISFPLDESLCLLNILVKSDHYRCKLHSRILENATVDILEGVFSKGTSRERREAVELMRQMCIHECPQHENMPYVSLLLRLFVGIKADKIPKIGSSSLMFSASASGPFVKNDEPFTAKCRLAKRSMTYIRQVLKIPDSFIDHSQNLCFCETCMEERGDQEVYTRGDPPKSYALPQGWFRFGLRLPPRATPLKVFEKWHVGYHGTRSECILPIMNVGDIVMSGDQTADTEVKPPSGHFTKEHKPEGFDIQKVFLSPSMKYSGLEVYAKSTPYTDPKKSTQQLSAKVGFQVRIQPGTYDISQETVGAKKCLDKNFKNSEIEWSTKLRGVIILTGILVQIKRPK